MNRTKKKKKKKKRSVLKQATLIFEIEPFFKFGNHTLF